MGLASTARRPRSTAAGLNLGQRSSAARSEAWTSALSSKASMQGPSPCSIWSSSRWSTRLSESATLRRSWSGSISISPAPSTANSLWVAWTIRRRASSRFPAAKRRSPSSCSAWRTSLADIGIADHLPGACLPAQSAGFTGFTKRSRSGIPNWPSSSQWASASSSVRKMPLYTAHLVPSSYCSLSSRPASLTPWLLTSRSRSSAPSRSLKLPRMTVSNSSGRVVVVGATVVSGGSLAWAVGGEPGEERPRMAPATRPRTAATAAIAGPGRGQRVSYMAPDATPGPTPGSTSAGLLAVPAVGVAQLRAADLAGEGLGQVVDELELARVGVGRQPLADVPLELADQLLTRLGAGDQPDEGLDDVAALGVGAGHHRRLGHRRVLQQGALDLERPDPVAGRDDHVVGPARVPDVAVLVLAGGVLGVEPVAAEDLLGVLGTVPVAERVVGVGAGPEADLARLALGDGLFVGVEDGHLPAGQGQAHGAGPDLDRRVVGAQRVALGQAVVVEHRAADRPVPPGDRLGVERLAGRAGQPQVAEVELG